MAMEQTAKKRVLRLVFFTFLALCGILLLYLLYRFTGIGFKCPFYEITGLKCAGCGNTHALQSLLTFDIVESFSYNYIYPLEMFYILWVYFHSAKGFIRNGKFNYVPPFKAFDIVVLIIIVLWIPLRNISGV